LVLINYNKIPLVFHFLISFCYIGVGCALFTDLFGTIDVRKRAVFGVIVIGYGIFRMYKAFKQYGRQREDAK
jgi:cytochrome c biogenesis protein CcdA